jgi:hypothetical protein
LGEVTFLFCSIVFGLQAALFTVYSLLTMSAAWRTRLLPILFLLSAILCHAQDTEHPLLEKLSTGVLVKCLSDNGVCGAWNVSTNGYEVSAELARRGHVDQLIKNYGLTENENIRYGIEHAAYMAKSPGAAAYFRTLLSKNLDDGEDLYWPIKYLALRCDRNALRRFVDTEMNGNRFSVSSYELSTATTAIGKCRYRAGIPFLVNPSLRAASLNRVDAAEQSLKIFFPEAPAFHDLYQMQRWYCRKAATAGYAVDCRGIGPDVPFVGCSSDGQLGPRPARTKVPNDLPDDPSGQLAYYQAEEGPGILAPKGWHCFGTYGSNGSSLYISPDAVSAEQFFHDEPKWRGLRGYGIQITALIGDTSGRFEVAKLVARVFPKHRDYVTRVVAEGLEPAKNFPTGPYLTDTLHYKSDTLVRFETPAQHRGLGTDSWFQTNDQPIHGSIQFNPVGDNEATAVYLRLPAAYDKLIPEILRAAQWHK